MSKNKLKEPKVAYLTTRILKRASKSAVKAAAENAMQVAGYVVKVQDGWVIREYENGDIERISELGPSVDPNDLILD